MYNTQDWTWGNTAPIATTATKLKKKNRKGLIFGLVLLWAGSGIYYQYNKEEIPQITPKPTPRPEPEPMPDWWINFEDNINQEEKDSIIISEKRLIKKWQSEIKWDTLNINVSYTDTEKNWNLPKNKIIKIGKEDLIKLEKETNSAINAMTIVNKWRKVYIDYIKSSTPILKKIVSWIWIDKIKDRDQKIKAISLFIQSRDMHNQMWYKHDLVNTRKWIDTVDYIRPPAVSIIDWLKSWEQWDCDDFASNFIALCIASGIPESDIYMIFSHTHAFVGIKWYQWKLEGKKYYFSPKWEKIIPIENTTNTKESIIHNYLNYKKDTLTTRSRTIWWVDNSNAPEVKIRNSEYPDWFTAKRRGK